MGKLRVESLVLGMVATNCYLLQNRETGEIVIMDPADEAERIEQKVAQMGGKPRAILLTHGHFDHIGAADALRRRYEIPVCAPRAEAELLQDPNQNLSLAMGGRGITVTADQLFEDEQCVTFAGLSLQVLYTPGHTCGSACYYLEEEQVLFSGDTLFHCSVGRTDLPTGSMSRLHDSIHRRLFVLPEQTLVYPGHDQMTDIGYEKKYNPY